MKEYFVQFCAERGEGEPLHRSLLRADPLQRLPSLHPRVSNSMLKIKFIHLLSLVSQKMWPPVVMLPTMHKPANLSGGGV